jgi:2-methylcitrate dehydratase PrpD
MNREAIDCCVADPGSSGTSAWIYVHGRKSARPSCVLHNAAGGPLLGMTEAQIANPIAIAARSDASLAVIRAKPLSQWN